MSLYLYAILRDNTGLNSLPVKGMNQQVVEFYSLPPFAIAYSEAKQERYLSSRANLLAHETVLEAIMKELDPQVAVPLPLQFGLVVEDWAEVQQQLLFGHQTQLEALLDKLIGKREVGIKLFWDQAAELNLVLQNNPELSQRRDALSGKPLSMDEAISIGQELEASLEQHKQLVIKTFLDRLLPLSYEHEEGELLTSNMLYNAAFLIAWEQEPAFAAAIEALDGEFDHRLRIRYNNFTAPFNFVKLGEDG